MATTIKISIGTLTAERVFTKDAVAQEILMLVAGSIDATGTNQEKLQGVVNWLVGQIEERAKQVRVVTEQRELYAREKAEKEQLVIDHKGLETKAEQASKMG